MFVSFLSYFLTLLPSVNGFAELTARVSELGSHVAYDIGIHFKRVGFELYMYVYNIILYIHRVYNIYILYIYIYTLG